jgi:large subunit ribosomal protein L29
MKPSELRNMTNEELKQKELQLSEELFNLRMRNALGQVENPMKIKATKRDIARAKTILYEKETEKTA